MRVGTRKMGRAPKNGSRAPVPDNSHNTEHLRPLRSVAEARWKSKNRWFCGAKVGSLFH